MLARGHSACPIDVTWSSMRGDDVSADISYCRCACCSTLQVVYVETADSPYCIRCEVAYLEFKLRLLLAVRCASRRSDEV